MTDETTQNQENQTSEYKWNWKKEFKDSFKRMVSELFSLICILITLAIVVLSRTEQQLKAIATVIDGDWVMIAMLLIGLLAMSVVVEKILKFFFWLIKTPIVAIWKKSVKK